MGRRMRRWGALAAVLAMISPRLVDALPTLVPSVTWTDLPGLVLKQNFNQLDDPPTHGFSTLKDSVRVDATSGVDCTGASDSTVGLQTALDALASTGQTLLIPSNCRLGLGSPSCVGSVCGPSVTIPNNIHILCEDRSAGFFAVRKHCVGGDYPDAACSTNTECNPPSGIGGGICNFDFGSTTYANDVSNTYTMLADASPQSSNIFIQNCSFWTYQADPYQRCSNTGTPCRQECDGSGGSTAGARCDSNADCNSSAGVCLRTAACAAGGGTCTAAPHASAGTSAGTASGKINPLDLSRTFNARLEGVSIYDHFTGDFAIKLGDQATLLDVNLAREITDCTSPIPTTPSNSTCFTTSNGQCCYGAAFGPNNNTQPTVAVTNDLIAGADAQLTRVTARGSTTSFQAGARSRIDKSTIWPQECLTYIGVPIVGHETQNFGPGRLASGGYDMTGIQSQVTKSFALNLAAGAPYCIMLAADDSDAVGDKCNGGEAAGIIVAGANSHVVANNIKGLNSTNAIGIRLGGNNGSAAQNHVEGGATTGTGVLVTGNGSFTGVGNHVIGNTIAGSLNFGVSMSGAASSTTVENNFVTGVQTAAFTLPGGGIGNSIIGNTSDLFNGNPTTTLHPIHVLNEGTGNQLIVSTNVFRHGWRGYATGTRSNSNALTNTTIENNRFIGLAGAPVAAGGAGITVAGNYMNLRGDIFANGLTLSCDPSCAGGSPVTRGTICQQDSDCTANGNTCNASVRKCIPEPVNGFIGSPTAIMPSNHNTWSGNMAFNGQVATMRQCSVVGNIGQKCDVASCASPGVCQGTVPQTCSGGADNGKLCCQTAAGATCAIRDPTVHLRVVDYGTIPVEATHSLLMVAGNTFFGGDHDIINIDMQNTAALGNLNLRNFIIENNNFLAPSTTNTIAIRFPTRFSRITDFGLIGNHFSGYSTPAATGNIANYQGGFGSLSLDNGVIFHGQGTALRTTAGNDFFSLNSSGAASARETNVNAFIAPTAMTLWKMTCDLGATPGADNTRRFFLRAAAATSSMLTCTIGNPKTSCTPTAGANSTPFSVSAGQSVNFMETATGTPAAATANCAVYASYDSFF